MSSTNLVFFGYDQQLSEKIVDSTLSFFKEEKEITFIKKSDNIDITENNHHENIDIVNYESDESQNLNLKYITREVPEVLEKILENNNQEIYIFVCIINLSDINDFTEREKKALKTIYADKSFISNIFFIIKRNQLKEDNAFELKENLFLNQVKFIFKASASKRFNLQDYQERTFFIQFENDVSVSDEFNSFLQKIKNLYEQNSTEIKPKEHEWEQKLAAEKLEEEKWKKALTQKLKENQNNLLNGFSSVREIRRKIVSALRDISVILGDHHEEAVTLEMGDTIIPGLGCISDAHTLAEHASNIQKGSFDVIFIGGFKNGKSTLINAMFGENVLPTRVSTRTTIISKLVYGDSKKVALYESNNDSPRYLTWEEYQTGFQLKEIDKQVQVDKFSNIEYAQIESQNSLCDSGVKLIDSPGLHDNIVRAKVANNFLKQSQAVIFLLNATQILTQHEKEIIQDYFNPGKVNNVFFVVNKFDCLRTQNDRDEIQEDVKYFLKDYFINSAGEFDEELYNSRVFFTSAQNALDARISKNNAALQSSGIPGLESELEKFLASPEKIATAFQSTIKLLSLIISQSRNKITTNKLALYHSLDKLEERQQDHKNIFQDLREDKNKISRTLLMYGSTINQKIYNSLSEYINNMKNDWSSDSNQYIQINEERLQNILQAPVQQKARRSMAEVISSECKSYLRIKLQEWSQQILITIIQEDIEQMMNQVHPLLFDFDCKMLNIRNVFSGDNLEDKQSEADQKRIQIIFEKLLNHPLKASRIIYNDKKWDNLFDYFIQEVVYYIMTVELIKLEKNIETNLYKVVQNILIKSQYYQLKQRIFEHLQEELFKNIQEQLIKDKDNILKTIENIFIEFSTVLDENLQQQIYETEASQNRIINKKQSSNFLIEKENNRLDDIADRLLSIFVKAVI